MFRLCTAVLKDIVQLYILRLRSQFLITLHLDMYILFDVVIRSLRMVKHK